MFASVAQTPAALAFRQRLESGGVLLPCAAVSASAHPFFAALLHHLFPPRPVVVVTDGLKTQESFHQDVSTWLRRAPAKAVSPAEEIVIGQPLFYPAWDTLPEDDKLPHADVFSDRLETLVTLSAWNAARTDERNPAPASLLVKGLRRWSRCPPGMPQELLNEIRHRPSSSRAFPLCCSALCLRSVSANVPAASDVGINSIRLIWWNGSRTRATNRRYR